MSAPTFNIAESNGATPTVTTVTTIAHASIDAASTGTLSAANPVPAGQNSFEKWLRLQVATVATNAISAMSVYFNATAPTDSAAVAATVARFFGVNAPYAAPVSAVSTVAATNCNTVTASPGTAFTTPANTALAFSGYVTQQYRLTSAAAGGNAVIASPEFTFSYTWS